MYIVHVMFVLRIELWSRHFTNFHYYYYVWFPWGQRQDEWVSEMLPNESGRVHVRN